MHLRGVLLQSKQELYLFISSRLLVKPTTKLIVYGLLDPNTLDLRYVGRSSSGLVRPKKHIWNMTENKTRYSHLRIYRWIEILRRDVPPSVRSFVTDEKRTPLKRSTSPPPPKPFRDGVLFTTTTTSRDELFLSGVCAVSR